MLTLPGAPLSARLRKLHLPEASFGQFWTSKRFFATYGLAWQICRAWEASQANNESYIANLLAMRNCA